MKRTLLIVLMAILLQACHTHGGTKFNTASTQTIDQTEFVEKTETHTFKEGVMISSGYANISAQSSDNPSQRRLMAIRASKIDAYRNLTERVYGQNINASTTVEDMIATNDAVRAHVQGLIYGARLVSIEPIGGDSYETRLELSEKRVNEIRNLFLFK